ncbi:Uncharacterized protein Fot_10473 [Forsythia ovata]|uniref:Uncharacterized protein n=1 Tax=Forsythia ovata TaxID=205694 RepID=A0ABD1WJQ4_9LAMI
MALLTIYSPQTSEISEFFFFFANRPVLLPGRGLPPVATPPPVEGAPPVENRPRFAKKKLRLREHHPLFTNSNTSHCSLQTYCRWNGNECTAFSKKNSDHKFQIYEQAVVSLPVEAPFQASRFPESLVYTTADCTTACSSILSASQPLSLVPSPPRFLLQAVALADSQLTSAHRQSADSSYSSEYPTAGEAEYPTANIISLTVSTLSLGAVALANDPNGQLVIRDSPSASCETLVTKCNSRQEELKKMVATSMPLVHIPQFTTRLVKRPLTQVEGTIDKICDRD